MLTGRYNEEEKPSTAVFHRQSLVVVNADFLRPLRYLTGNAFFVIVDILDVDFSILGKKWEILAYIWVTYGFLLACLGTPLKSRKLTFLHKNIDELWNINFNRLGDGNLTGRVSFLWFKLVCAWEVERRDFAYLVHSLIWCWRLTSICHSFP